MTLYQSIMAMKKGFTAVHVSMCGCTALSGYADQVKNPVDALFQAETFCTARKAFGYTTAMSACVRKLKSQELRSQAIADIPKPALALCSPKMVLLLGTVTKEQKGPFEDGK